jgi:5-oxoprolinase (ATP-hydrolysing)
MNSQKEPENINKWQFWVDRGGTFTDIIGRSPNGELITKKLLSLNPGHYEDATLQGIREILHLPANAPIESSLVECVKMGTTVATNALLERKGQRTALLITKGFRDALRIAYQNRPKIFERHIILPELLYETVVEAQERIDSNGSVITPLGEQDLLERLTEIKALGIKSLAIVFMHAYEYPSNELLAYELAKKIGFEQISLSHQVAPLIKLISRGDTTVVDAYLTPVLNQYVDGVRKQMPNVKLLFMQSSGGLTQADLFAGKDAILSGPAGGIVGMSRTAKTAGESHVIGFDMGGTSTDVSHFAGEFERDYETQVAGVRIRAPMMSIHTVASGGGSVLGFDGNSFKVGPQSAGAHPGPASYGKGGPLTLTDANLLLGKIQRDYFPKVFGESAQEPLSITPVIEGFRDFSRLCNQTPEQVAEGFVAIAVEQMANAIKKISVAKGYDINKYTLQCFGGAGGQHACLVANALGMNRVMIHPFAGLLSAYGMGLADQSIIKERTLELPLSLNSLELAKSTSEELRKLIDSEVKLLTNEDETVQYKVHLKIKYSGSDTSLEVKFTDLENIKKSFEDAYLKRFSFLMKEKPLVIESINMEGLIEGNSLNEVVREASQTVKREIPSSDIAVKVKIYTDGCWQETPLIERENLLPGDIIQGPLLITEHYSTIVVEPGWCAMVNSLKHIILTRDEPKKSKSIEVLKSDPIRLEIFNNLFMNIAEQMGLRLQNTAHSVNIKERLDFSCAIFDGKGKLIANAPHMPVHLGSMGESVKSVIEANSHTMRDGDVFVLNDPYHGGTHLPDITVITPCFIKEYSETLPFLYVGSRGHHADVGGITPGSMPAFSKSIEEEGVMITNFKLVDKGIYQEEAMLHIFSDATYPCRNPQQNMSDLRAQIAANEKGIQELKKSIEQYGFKTVEAYMQFVQDHARSAVSKLFRKLRNGSYTLNLDNGAKIVVSVNVKPDKQSAEIDFSGTSDQLPNNFNAPKAVTVAAVLYVLRSMIDDEIPLNAGCLENVSIIVPKGSMLNPSSGAAVVAGNVETSMCITNALFGAFGVMASSQPTMNNLTFGNSKHQYYETIAGGSGAGGYFDQIGQNYGGFNGTSMVQTHMTNSRLTDPEVLEKRFPVILESFAVRPNSGGIGKYSGGDGGVRKIRFLEEMTLSILSNGRIFPAFGMSGGQHGAPGENWIVRANGERESLNHNDQIHVNEGDIIEIHTPGGGGFGQLDVS